MKTGDLVKINDRTDWYGMYGVIDRVHGDVAFVYCVGRPGKLHATSLSELVPTNL